MLPYNSEQDERPTVISDIDETGVTVKSQSQTFKVARPCVRKTGGEKDLGDAELDPLHARFRGFGRTWGVN